MFALWYIVSTDRILMWSCDVYNRMSLLLQSRLCRGQGNNDMCQQCCCWHGVDSS